MRFGHLPCSWCLLVVRNCSTDALSGWTHGLLYCWYCWTPRPRLSGATNSVLIDQPSSSVFSFGQIGPGEREHLRQFDSRNQKYCFVWCTPFTFFRASESLLIVLVSRLVHWREYTKLREWWKRKILGRLHIDDRFRYALEWPWLISWSNTLHITSFLSRFRSIWFKIDPILHVNRESIVKSGVRWRSLGRALVYRAEQGTQCDPARSSLLTPTIWVRHSNGQPLWWIRIWRGFLNRDRSSSWSNI